MHKPKNIFVEGPISPEKISDMIKEHQSKQNIGAHDIFLGQVRSDALNESKVIAIEYSAYEDMALESWQKMKDELFEKYELTCMHIKHSLGRVEAGEISFLVFVSAPHRQSCFDACREAVDKIKKDLPIWGKEILENESHTWKVNEQA